MLRALTVLALALIAMPLHAADADAGRTKANTCLGCHGIPGYDNTYPHYKVPKLFGQHATYLEAALHAYRDGARVHPTMSAQAAALSDEDIADIAAYFESALVVSPGTPVGQEDRAAVCAGCHMADGVSTIPDNPILAGQHASYIVQALHGYRDGTRTNAIMAGMTMSLTDADIEALAHYFAMQQGLGDHAPQ